MQGQAVDSWPAAAARLGCRRGPHGSALLSAAHRCFGPVRAGEFWAQTESPGPLPHSESSFFIGSAALRRVQVGVADSERASGSEGTAGTSKQPNAHTRTQTPSVPGLAHGEGSIHTTLASWDQRTNASLPWPGCLIAHAGAAASPIIGGAQGLAHPSVPGGGGKIQRRCTVVRLQ
jgi:hypothetical protein